MHGLVMLDEMGEVIRPSIIWCDQRTGAEVEDMLKTVSYTHLFFASFKSNDEIFGSICLLPQNFSFKYFIEGWKGSGKVTYTTFFIKDVYKRQGMQGHIDIWR